MYRKAPGHVAAALQDGIMYKKIYYSQRQPAHHPHQELASRGGPVQREQLADPVPLQQGPGLSPDSHQRQPPDGPLGLQQDREDRLHDGVHHDS